MINRVRFHAYSVIRLVIAVTRDMREGHLTLRASALVYNTFLSLVPLLALSFSILKGFGIHNQMEPFLLNALSPLGDQSRFVTEKIVSFVEKMNLGVLGAVGLAMLIYSVIGMMNNIEKAFNDIWRIKKTRPFVLKVRDYLSLLFIGPILMFISLAITTSLRHADFFEAWLGAGVMTGISEAAGILIANGLFVVAFTALYMFMPYARVRLGPALVAGIVTAALWKILGILFGLFVAGSGGYAAVYSAFAVLFLCMLWVYIGWYTILIGASVCFYLQYPSNQSLSRKVHHLSLRVKEKMALQICAMIAERFYARKPALDVQQLSRAMALPAVAVEDVVEDLLRSGVLTTTGPRHAFLTPALPFDATSVAQVLSIVRAVDEDESFSISSVTAAPRVEDVFLSRQVAVDKDFGRLMLKDLVSHPERTSS